MIKLFRTNSEDITFKELVKALDKELEIRDGADHSFYDQFNKIENINYVVLAVESNKALGCGALKEFSEKTMEVKRMFVPPENRRKGIASLILEDLEKWSKEMGYEKCLLETGQKQPEAIALYTKCNYNRIPNYGPYENVQTSVCFEKVLKNKSFNKIVYSNFL